MNTLDLEKIDWSKLNGFNQAISANIKKQLPADWYLTDDEIKSEVNAVFVYLIKLYRPKEDGLSLTSYCWKYAEQIAYDRLMKEYNRIKK